ncbi:MAG: class I SAM-dependent methyltransferase [Clostridiales bacterium]|nr:class I SAM-dependent methyltransferase [Clostridiales bacterium]
MEKRLVFNEDVLNYDKSRPRYCDELFSDIIKRAELGAGKSCLEIGCGTGQATEPFLRTGSSVIAIELGDKMAAYARMKFENYDNFQVINMDFENYDCGGKFDLIYSASAFHWINEETGYPKVFDMLKNGGTLALFWNRTIPTADPLQMKIYEVYKKYRDYTDYVDFDSLEESLAGQYENIKKTIAGYGFVDIESNLYKSTRILNADKYISLLNTYSNHVSIPEPAKSRFFSEIKEAIISFGDIIKIYDTMDLYLARKP